DTGERTGAWDEVYYSGDADIPAAVALWGALPQLASPPNGTAILSRMRLLSDQINLYYARFALVGSPRVTQVFQGQLFGLRGSDNFAGDAAVMRGFNQARTVAREFRFGGLPDNVVSGNK